MGYGGAQVNVRSQPSMGNDVTVNLNVQRTSTGELIAEMGGI